MATRPTISASSPDGTDSGNAVTTSEAVTSKTTAAVVVVATTTATADTKTTTTSSDHSTTTMQNAISNFDVLLMTDEETGILNFYKSSLADGSGTAATEEQQPLPQNHVGNQRFQVTLNMHRQDFETRHSRGQDTSPVVNKLIAIVSQKCVPPGRFLQKCNKNETSTTPGATTENTNNAESTEDGSETNFIDSKDSSKQEEQQQQESSAIPGGGWRIVPRPLVEEFIERSLMPLPDDKTNHNTAGRRASKILNGGAATAASTIKETFRRISFAKMDASALIDDGGGDDDDNDDSPTGPQTHNPAAPAIPPPPEHEVPEDEKKRRRRSSLLRRSLLSDHLLPPAALEIVNKKKMNRTTEERRPSFWRAFGKHNLIKQTETLDIVLSFTSEPKSKESGRDEIIDIDGVGVGDNVGGCKDNSGSNSSSSDSDHPLSPETADLVPNETTGNNRLRVLMQMHKERYAQVSADKQAKIVQDWIQTVNGFWKGRFLKFDTVLESYVVLDAGQVEMALRSIITRMIDGNDYDVPPSAGHAAAEETLNPLWEASEGDSSDSLRETSSSHFFNNNSQLSINSAPGRFSTQQFAHNASVVGGQRQRQVSTDNSVVSAPPTTGAPQPRRRSVKDFLPQLPQLGEIARGFSDGVVQRSNGGGSIRRQERQQTRLSFNSGMSGDSKLPNPPMLPPNARTASDSEMQGMRSAALESLQRRKKRQGLASRIQKLAQNSLRRTSGAISTAAAAAATSSSSSTVASGAMASGGATNGWNSNSFGSSSSSNEFPPPPRSILGSSFRRTSVMSTMSTNSATSSKQGGGGGDCRAVKYPSMSPPLSASPRRTSASSMSTMGSTSRAMDNNPQNHPLTEEITFERSSKTNSKPPASVLFSQPFVGGSAGGVPAHIHSAPPGTSLGLRTSTNTNSLTGATFPAGTGLAPPLPTLPGKEGKQEVGCLDGVLQDDSVPSEKFLE